MTTNFKEFALNPALQTSLESMQFEIPTPIQALAIPFALEGRDILGSAQTGTGKTAAFCVPMINFLLNNPAAHALVMLPTRELASQVHDVARKMIGAENKGPNGIKTALLIGGEPIGKQYAQLDRRPRLIVGTPGRINDHLRSNGDLVDRVAFVVLDEADRMLDMGFAPQIDSILSETALQRQTLMFSATFPDNIVKFTKQYLNNPERVSAGVQSKPGENIVQESITVPQEQKYDELMLQLQKREGSVIIFVRTQHGADKLSVKLNKDEHTSEAIHGGLRQRQRDKVIGMFRKSSIRILVATDVAARGLDVPHIEHVINFDLPQVAEDYVHRIGRTARAGAKGHAVSFISPGEKHLWRDIERMLDPEAANSDVREGGRGKGGARGGFGGGKKFGGGNGGGKSYGDRSGPRKESGGYAQRKPMRQEGGRADRKDSRENGWSPAGDFEHAPRAEGERSFKKPFAGRAGNSNENRPDRGGDNFASNPDSYKRTNSAERKEGGFKKPFVKRDGGQSDRPYSNDRPRPYGDRPQGDRPYNRDGGQGRNEGRSEGGFKKPFSRDGNTSDRPRGDRPYSNDRPRGDRPSGDRPYNRDGGQGRNEGRSGGRSEGGFKKPYTPREGQSDRPRSDRPQGDRPYNRDGGQKRTEGGFKKPFSRDGQKPSGGDGNRFRKDGAQRSDRPQGDRPRSDAPRAPFKKRENSAR